MSDHRALLDKATPLPWESVTFGNASTAKVAGRMAHSAYASSRAAGVPQTDLTQISAPSGNVVGYTGNGPHSPENGRLIVAAVNALPALLDVVEAARVMFARAGAICPDCGEADPHSPDDGSCAALPLREALARLEVTR